MRLKKIRRGTIIFIIILSIPFWSHLFWYLQKPKILNILILDKTVPVLKRNEHRSFNWLLTHLKYYKPGKNKYSINSDYHGFFPYTIPTKKDSGKYIIRDLEDYADSQLDSMANALDVLYYTDTYGVYYNEWYRHKMLGEHSERIYGGLANIDVSLIEKMKTRKKLILTEFNFYASPTNFAVRKKAEDLLGIRWHGWTFRYFDVLDTNYNHELPKWVISLYMQQHNNTWPFKKSGIVMHLEPDDVLEILDEDLHLSRETPYIITGKDAQDKYNLPSELHYPYWFDYTDTIGRNNEIIAHIKIYTNASGDSLLMKYNLPSEFPCIIRHKKPGDYTFYYFSGDFADNPIDNLSAYFKGVRIIDHSFYSNKPNDRSKFFWKYYYPLMKTILRDYYVTKNK